ncbi:hypothetical protein AAVH_18627 [Aphelenchoides avenae]|nr:hypothetical protein AAVH_18627 [Aphelenchus avenae]
MVLGKYPDGDEWLGCRGAPGEWPVAYHGTTIKNVNAIIREGFKPDKCHRATFGKGIYCSPNPEVAKRYSTAYEAYNATATTPGSFYEAVLQVRVRPEKKQVFLTQHKDEYWLVTDETAIRPYRICVFEAVSVQHT